MLILKLCEAFKDEKLNKTLKDYSLTKSLNSLTL
jgi:hypothetical protein